jgi:5-methylcytosine-specific restriction endonuclease McrA
LEPALANFFDPNMLNAERNKTSTSVREHSHFFGTHPMKMSFDDYCATINSGRRLSAVKQIILKRLWGDESELTPHWVKSAELLALTQQKYFDRRARELRDENGCDIETKFIDGEHQWKLNSTNLGKANTRAYLNEGQKIALFANANYRCSICNKETQPGVRGLQADHKIPLIRGGSHALDNWQSICNECNVAKRRACSDCQLECKHCSWAFPIEQGMPLTFRVEPMLFDLVDNEIKRNPNFLNQVLLNYFKNVP